MRVPSFHPLRVGSSPAHPGYPLPLLWVHRASQEPLSAWARSPDITPDKLHGEGKNQLGGERLGIYSGSRKAGRQTVSQQRWAWKQGERPLLRP